MTDPSTFISLLPEVQEYLSPNFSLVDCSLGLGPDLSRPPFNRSFRNLGQQITFVPDSKVVEDLDKTGQHEIVLGESSFVLTDSSEGSVMEIALEGGSDWLTPLTALFHNIFANKWTFLVAEVENGKAFFHVISSKESFTDKPKSDSPDRPAIGNFSLWIVPVSKIFAIPPPPKKVRVVKRIVKKKSPSEGGSEGGSTEGIVKKVLRKKKVETGEEGAVNGSSPPTEEGQISVKKEVRGNEKGEEDCNGVSGSHSNGNGEGSVSSLPPRSSNGSGSRMGCCATKEVNGSNGGNASHSPNGVSSPLTSSSAIHTFLHPPISSSALSNGKGGENGEKGEKGGKGGKSGDSSDDEDFAARLRMEIMERDRLNRLREEPPMRKDSLIRRQSSRSPTRALAAIREARSRMGGGCASEEGAASLASLPMGRSGTFMSGRPSCDTSPPRTPTIAQSSLFHIPVIALQLLLRKMFSFEELGKLRNVHPHWDEICGQLLNGGYYALLERTDRMLMKYQRRVHSNSALHYPVALLTNIQVHILNPVDLMRAALDEGICCFPYGVIIDRTIVMLDEIERMVDAGEQVDIAWEGVAVLAKRASTHYRTHLEGIMEERMGTCARLKAAQRIIRMDSMIVEHNVHKLEKESVRARDDLKWELEQVQQSCSSLKKENRQLKADQMKLESRVESLENKLRSICRLLT